MKNGIELITEERTRQIEVEGRTPQHDDEHGSSELVDAAMCYIATSANEFTEYSSEMAKPPYAWPWADDWWKPSGPVRNLVKAGALIAAEIDRIQRKMDEERCPSTLPDPRFPVRCTLRAGHTGNKHGGGGCEWTSRTGKFTTTPSAGPPELIAALSLKDQIKALDAELVAEGVTMITHAPLTDITPSKEDAKQWKRENSGHFISPELEDYVATLMSDYAMEVLARSGYFDGRDHDNSGQLVEHQIIEEK